MARMNAKRAAVLALVAAVLGLVFAAYSTFDYAQQLDRQVHAVHCSFIPGAPVSADADNPCKAALFSPYSAIFRATYWGGVPISLFGLGAFAFFVGFAVYLRAGDRRVSRLAHPTFVALTLGPLATSALMFTISVTRLHELCKLCVGIYTSSLVLFVAAILGARAHSRDVVVATAAGAPRPEGGWGLPLLALVALGASALAPALVYVTALPDYRPMLTKCGKLTTPTDPHHGLLKIPTSHPVRTVVLFEDPLCPTCKAFHERLVDEGIFERLDITMAMFPLESDCNWMLDRSLHPGACVMAKAVICGGTEKARAVLEWAYEHQESLREVGKQGGGALAAKISERWGPELSACVASEKTTVQLNQQLHFAANNHIPVSTPQMFLGDKRLCDEDTDLGLKYTLAQLAPEVLPTGGTQ
jgi:uncharacterized membrane protein